jgi:hypothetical protein
MVSTLFILALLQMSASEQSSDAVACDASTLLQSQTKIDSKQTAWLGKPSDLEPMLQFVESMRTKNPPERDMSQLSTIKDILTDTLLPGLESDHAFGQQQIDASKNAIDQCITDAEAHMTDVYTFGNASVTRENNHTVCRGEEKDDNDEMTSDCNDLNTFVTDTVFPSIPEPPEIVTLRPILKRYKNLAIAFETKDAACNSSTTVHDDKVEDCDEAQSLFETAFCEYRQALLGADSTYTTCNNEKTSSHSSLVTVLEGKVIGWKAEYKAIKKILCYLNVWLHDGDESTVNTALATSCEDDSIDTSPMDISYPTVPSAKVINVAPVQEFPGSTNWPERYSALTTYDDDITVCSL